MKSCASNHRFQKLSAVIDARNAASLAAAKKAGFSRMNLPVLKREDIGELLIFQCHIK